MTAYEFRGFLANFMVNAMVVGAAAITGAHWKWWEYLLVGAGLILFFPLIGYHPKPGPKTTPDYSETWRYN